MNSKIDKGKRTSIRVSLKRRERDIRKELEIDRESPSSFCGRKKKDVKVPFACLSACPLSYRYFRIYWYSMSTDRTLFSLSFSLHVCVDGYVSPVSEPRLKGTLDTRRSGQMARMDPDTGGAIPIYTSVSFDRRGQDETLHDGAFY